MLGPLHAEDAAAAGGRGAMATRQGWGLPWRREAQHPEPALGEGCSRWGGRQDRGTPGAEGCQSRCSGSGKAPSSESCSWPAAPGGSGQAGPGGVQALCLTLPWTHCDHHHRHLRPLPGSLGGMWCQCLHAQPRGATGSAGHAVSSEASLPFAARRVCRASLHASDMSMNTKYLVTPLGCHYPPTWEWLCGIRLGHRAGFSS